MKLKKKSTIPVFFVLFLIASQSIFAQQQKEFFINPLYNTVGAEFDQTVDLSRFKYQWEVISSQNEVIIPRTAVPSAQIRERFITSSDEVKRVTANFDEITIRWNGRRTDDEIPEDGKYFINVYETANNNSKTENQYRYPVTIITEEIYFHIALESKTINRKAGQWLICMVEPEGTKQVNAYSWKAEIRNAKDGKPVDEQPFRSGQESPFPRFMWNEYENLAGEIVYLEITVEATDRTGTTYKCQNPLPFTIVDGGEVGYISDTELINQLELSRSDYKQLQSKYEQLLREIGQGRSNFAPGSDGKNYSWPLSSEYETYTVLPGDFLVKIARKKYGEAYLWGMIYELNKDDFPRPGDVNLILPGMELRLPPRNVLENLRNSVGQ